VVDLVNRTRSHPAVELGGSPRAGIALIKSSRARALLHGRDYVIPEDLFALAEDVILHRMRLRYESLAEGLTTSMVLEDILASLGGGTSVLVPQAANGRVTLGSPGTPVGTGS